MTLIQWNSDYALGIKEIDEQHQELFSLVNRVAEMVENDCDPVMVGPTVDKLVEYTIYHFNEEEELMLVKKYPKLGQHRILHGNLTDQVLRFKAELRQSSRIDCQEFLEFLSDWLKKHTTTSDVEYAEYIRRMSRS